MVGNNTPVFFVRDPIKFPDFIHTQKRNPQSNLKDPDAYWDFLSLVPESIHQVSILFSDRGTPNGYRFMDGFSSHTLRMVNAEGRVHFCKWHFKTDQGIRNFTAEEAGRLSGSDPDYATRDLFAAIARREFPSWTVYLQILTEEQASKFPVNILDVTKVWPHALSPLVPIGRIVLNRNPDNFFAEIEQAAFSPSHMIPGIEASNDKMLQGRLFSYPDTHRHRLGPNYLQLPVNRPRAPVSNHQRDAFMALNGNQGSAPNYEPNSAGFALQGGSGSRGMQSQFTVEGNVARHPVKLTDDDFVQAGRLYQIQSTDAKSRMVSNIIGHLKNAKPHIRARQVVNFKRADKELGSRIEQGLTSITANRL
jgi:catalase